MTLAELIAQANIAGTYAALAAALNAPTVIPNPVAEPGQVPAPITLKLIMAQVPAAEMVKAYQLPNYIADLKEAIDTGDREWLAVLLGIAQAGNIISAETAAVLAPLLTAMVDDPAWAPTIAGPSMAQAAGLGVVSAADVQAALHP